MGGLHGVEVFLRCATCSSDSASVHACATFNAVLFCTFVVGRAGRAYVFCCVWALGRRFEFAVSWLCECRLSHLGGGVNKKNTLPGGRPANSEPAGACVRGAGKPQSGGQ